MRIMERKKKYPFSMKSATTPRELQDQLNTISEESYQLHQELASISERAAEAKFKLMETSKNGKEVDMKYDNTPDGRREAYLKIYLKGLSHKRTALIMEAKANSDSVW